MLLTTVVFGEDSIAVFTDTYTGSLYPCSNNQNLLALQASLSSTEHSTTLTIVMLHVKEREREREREREYM